MNENQTTYPTGAQDEDCLLYTSYPLQKKKMSMEYLRTMPTLQMCIRDRLCWLTG